MKRIISAVSLILLLVAVFATPADAATGFALVNGFAEQKSEGQYFSEAFSDFWSNIRIDVGGAHSFTAEAEGVAETEDDGTNIPYNGKIEGTFNPETGFMDGTYSLSEDFGDIDVCFKGSFTKYLETGENSVTLEFKKNEYGWKSPDGSCETGPVDLEYTVTFKVEGKIELFKPTPAPTMTFPDSGARFSDLAGEVEYLLPRGLKPNGQYDYNEEAWDSCELEMVLPEGTLIRTARNSTAIISFADMTTFVTKPETSIILGRPADPDSQFQLLVGGLWINVKRMIKDGSMEIEMNQELAGIKGTTLVLEDDGTTSTVKVIEGTVEVTAKADGKSRMVGAGSMLSADSRGLGELQTFDIAAESASWPQVAAIDAGNPSAAEPGEPDVVVLPYGSEADASSPETAEEHGPRIGLILGIYFFVAIVLVAAVVVIVLLTRRKKRL